MNLFYWFFESRNEPSSDPLVVWLTGGPGCSSMLALLVENGPFLIPEGSTDPVYNKYGRIIAIATGRAKFSYLSLSLCRMEFLC